MCDPYLSASEASFSQWGAIQIQLPFLSFFVSIEAWSHNYNQSINQSINQSVSQSVSQSVNESMNQLIHQLINQSATV